MIILIAVGAVILSFALGYGTCLYFIGRDPDIVHLQPGEVVTRRPKDGFVLAAVSPDVLRQLTRERKEGEEMEARNLYPRDIKVENFSARK